MAKEKDDVLQANAGAPEANIPDLKKKEKERKKAGAAWSGARGAASEFSGATGGNAARAAASAASAAGAGAVGEGAAGLIGAESGGFFAGIARFLAGIAESLGMGELWASVTEFLASMTSTLLGKMVVAAAAFLMVAAAGLLGYALLKGKGTDGLGSPNLGGIADSMRVRAGGDDRMGVDSKGELRFDPLNNVKPPVAAPPTDAKAGDAKPAPDVKADADAQKPVPSGLLAHNLSGSQLSSSLGGDFGNKNIFAGNSAAPKFGANNLSKLGTNPKGKLSAMKATSIHATPSSRSVGKGTASKAFGQLRLAKGLSQQGANATTAEQAAVGGQNAFEQQQATGGGLPTTGAPGGDTPPAMGGGAPDTNMPTAPGDPPMTTPIDTGLQNTIGQISSLANKAMSDIQTGTMEMVLGALLIGIGIGLLCIPTFAWGIALILAGTALLMMGMAKVAQGKQEAAQAIQMGQQLGQSIGDQNQANAITNCTNNAVATGTTVENCPQSVADQNNTLVNSQGQTYNQVDTIDDQKVDQIPVGTAKVIGN